MNYVAALLTLKLKANFLGGLRNFSLNGLAPPLQNVEELRLTSITPLFPRITPSPCSQRPIFTFFIDTNRVLRVCFTSWAVGSPNFRILQPLLTLLPLLGMRKLSSILYFSGIYDTHCSIE